LEEVEVIALESSILGHLIDEGEYSFLVFELVFVCLEYLDKGLCVNVSVHIIHISSYDVVLFCINKCAECSEFVDDMNGGVTNVRQISLDTL
jgi:hypothetical protein